MRNWMMLMLLRIHEDNKHFKKLCKIFIICWSSSSSSFFCFSICSSFGSFFPFVRIHDDHLGWYISSQGCKCCCLWDDTLCWWLVLFWDCLPFALFLLGCLRSLPILWLLGLSWVLLFLELWLPPLPLLIVVVNLLVVGQSVVKIRPVDVEAADDDIWLSMLLISDAIVASSTLLIVQYVQLLSLSL